MKRDMQGYGPSGPQVKWPDGARMAVNFVINYEEGAELSVVNGDKFAETYGGEFPLSPKQAGQRHLGMESLFEYGSRAGIWRLLRLFDKKQIPVTFFITTYALSLNPYLCQYLKSSSHDVAGHGWRWIDYSPFSLEQEREHIQKCLQGIRTLTGKLVTGWYTGRQSEHTKALLKEFSELLYCSDSYADDWPYYQDDLLIIPYSLDCNDFRYGTSPGWECGADFLNHLLDTFNYLYQENKGGIMTIGLHPRFSGHPGRAMVLERFINHILQFPDVWICKREEIARHWLTLRA